MMSLRNWLKQPWWACCSVWFTFIEYENNGDYNTEYLHENAQSHCNYPNMVGNHWEKYFLKDYEQVVNQSNNMNEDIECHKKVDEFISTRRIRSGKSLLHKTLRLRHFSSFDEQICRERNYIPALRLGISEYEFDIKVVKWPYDIVHNEFRAFPLIPILSSYTIFNRNDASTGTGVVAFKSRGECRLPCMLVIENKELSSKRFEMRCVPWPKICWYYIWCYFKW